MKKSILACSFYLFINTLLFAQKNDWAVNVGGASNDVGTSIALDTFGNIFTAGYFTGAANLDPTQSGVGTVVATNGSNNIYFAKYNSNGSFLWAKSIGGTSDDFGQEVSITTDHAGNAYVAGYFQGSQDFNTSSSTTNTLNSKGSTDIFIIKYDANGNYVWANGIGGSLTEAASAIHVDANGFVFVAGYFYGTVFFNPSSVVDGFLTSKGNADAFLAMYDPNGNFMWAKQMGGPSDDYAYSIASDQLGNIVVSGSFQATALFGAATLVSKGGHDGFISLFDISGTQLWSKGLGGSSDDYARSIAIDENTSDIIVAGDFSDQLIIDQKSAFDSVISDGGKDAFLAQYQMDGSFKWVKNIGGTSDDYGKSVIVGSNGDITIGGYFRGSMSFAPNTGLVKIKSKGDNDLFLGTYDKDGNYLWGKGVGGTSDDYGQSIVTDKNDHIFVTGKIEGSVVFDDNGVTGKGGSDVIIAKYSKCALPAISTQPIATITVCEGDSINIDLTASGGSIAFQWTKDGKDLVGGSSDDYAMIAEDISGGKYVCVLDNNCMIIYSDTVTVTVNLKPTKPLISNVPGTDTLDAGINLNSFNWTLDGNPISGNTKQIKTSQNGIYKVIGFDGQCFSDTSDAFIMSSTGIINSLQENGFKIYPNPNSGRFIIEATTMNDFDYELMDASGRLIQSHTGSSNKIEVRVDQLEKGVYFLKLEQAVYPILIK